MKRKIPALCVAIVTTVIAVQSIRRRSEEPGRHAQASAPVASCSDKQRAVVNGLEVGQSLGDYRVLGFRCAKPDVMEIDLRRDTIPLVLIVAKAGAVPHNAPRQTPEHDLFYGKQTPPNEPPTPQEIDTLLVFLAKLVEAAEKK